MTPGNRFQPTVSFHPLTTPAQPAVSNREWPTLTIYRDGNANLNALASALFSLGQQVGLAAPPATKPGRLAKAWQLHPADGGSPLFGRADRVTLLRFRLDKATLLLLFGESAADRLSFVLTPEPSDRTRFRLLPA